MKKPSPDEFIEWTFSIAFSIAILGAAVYLVYDLFK